ncbi:cysteinyl-tRNA synthetase [Saprolegnia parasitica CBS 223.65]|uniref:cysteine--tRNA ligase n=1 Tax=Saprolegnia parasitica (strain CBS 223.65) TaxID=695850 RepID=A0A067CIQ3_SAPPC|nr:cysteinyl-tRNA synthetase [Saprolegnia parasitica CBS 223.65]KDO29065.1 cysteinyl-tRNA synthetase [Saprolegnia parasitica CBS 223.65]|eukprot:XP_012200235.1 cysteinyl-tRNA synthetase [Saprolegnia parasitica CBS 223.65]
MRILAQFRRATTGRRLLSSASRPITALNSLSGKVEALPVASSGPLKWYVCGPTVYDSAHLGHARSYVSQDILRRVLTGYFRHDINLVMGMTDVDDKIIATSLREGKPMEAVARHHEAAFLADLASLNVLRASAITRVSEHIPEILAYIETLEANGFAYTTSDGVYFDTVALGADDAAAADDSGIGSEKRNVRDFALWKRSKTADEPGWDSRYGRGRPGWHIECSAMTHHVLGGSIDVHSGGIDLCFPHHNNEVAQCDGYHHNSAGHTWCKHFIHFGHLYIKGLKMSKSLKNFISIQDFLSAPGSSSDAFRLFCLQYKYNTNVHFSEDRMRDANVLLQRFTSFFQAVVGLTKASTPHRRLETPDDVLLTALAEAKVEVDRALRNDFDTPAVLMQLTQLISLVHREVQARKISIEVVCRLAAYVLETLHLFGLDKSLTGFSSIALAAPVAASDAGAGLAHAENILDEFTAFRARVRQVALANPKDPQSQAILALCDQLRNETLPPLGIQIDDVAPGTSHWKAQAMIEADAAPEDPVKTQLAAKQAAFEAEMQIAPADFFRRSNQFAGQFRAFDDEGVPTQDEHGVELTKTARKKLMKKLEKHTKSHDKYWATHR